MFQTRSFAFTLRNAGATHMPFRWAVLCGEDIDISGLYQVQCSWTRSFVCRPHIKALSISFEPWNHKNLKFAEPIKHVHACVLA